MGRLSLLVLLALAACGDRAPAPPPEANPPRVEAPADTGRLGDAPPTTVDTAAVIDSTEPPEQVVEIPPRPEPAPAPPPPRPEPPPPDGPSGSCDVRGTESFCFAYTGSGWTPQTARAHCDAAPATAFAPGTCPLVGRIATCAFARPDAPDREVVYTYYEPFDVDLAELACPGTFTRLR